MPDPIPDVMPLGPHVPRMLAPGANAALPLAGLTLLVVEDSRFSADVLRLLCQRSGARMRRAETRAQAMAHLRTYRPDVAIIDLGLPDGRGEEVIRALRHAGPVVLAMSGEENGATVAQQAGAMGFLAKPLPGLARFQGTILSHLPARLAIPSTDLSLPMGDGLALQDDLRHAARLLSGEGGAAAMAYVSGFLSGLARSTGNPHLALAAAESRKGAEGRARAHALIGNLVAAGAAARVL